LKRLTSHPADYGYSPALDEEYGFVITNPSAFTMSGRKRNQRGIFSDAHDLWDLIALFHTHKIKPASPIARYLNIPLIGFWLLFLISIQLRSWSRSRTSTTAS
jgi:hypothetical protein